MNIFEKFKIARIKHKVKKTFKKKLGYPLNLDNPKTYCEKIQWLKFNIVGNDLKVIERADKFLVRNFIKSKGFDKNLVNLYGYWEKPEDIDWDKLPSRFVLKWNNGSGKKYCWFIEDKSKLSITKFEKEAKYALKKKFGERKGEFHYGKIKPMLIAEEFLDDNSKGVIDYKFYCFNGKIAFFSVEDGKINGNQQRDYYNLDWTKSSIKFFNDVSSSNYKFKKPKNFDKMVLMAEELSKGFPHLRVDLYNIDGQIYFGELTYTPENGFTQWNPTSLDLKFGELMNIHNINH